MAAARHNRPTIIVYGGTIEVAYFLTHYRGDILIGCLRSLVFGMKTVLQWVSRRETLSTSARLSSLMVSIMKLRLGIQEFIIDSAWRVY